MHIARCDENLFDMLTELWERSVRASHNFLTDDDIAQLRPAVRNDALPALDLWVAFDEGENAIGFMGLAGNAVEALFIDPAWFGRGVGRQMLDHARGLHGPLTVEVNEQNPKACGFYAAYGFQKTGRSPTDAAGRPFPIIHMAMRGAENS